MSAATRRRAGWRLRRCWARHGLLLALIGCSLFWTALVLGIWHVAVTS